MTAAKKSIYQQSLGIHAMPKHVEEKLMQMFPVLRAKWKREIAPDKYPTNGAHAA